MQQLNQQHQIQRKFLTLDISILRRKFEMDFLDNYRDSALGYFSYQEQQLIFDSVLRDLVVTIDVDASAYITRLQHSMLALNAIEVRIPNGPLKEEFKQSFINAVSETAIELWMLFSRFGFFSSGNVLDYFASNADILVISEYC